MPDVCFGRVVSIGVGAQVTSGAGTRIAQRRFIWTATMVFDVNEVLYIRENTRRQSLLGCWDQPRKLHVCPGRYGIVVGSRVRGRSRDARPGVSSLLAWMLLPRSSTL